MANEWKWVIRVDDQGRATLERFGATGKKVDKEVEASAKRRSKEVKQHWGKAHKDMTGSMNKWKAVALGAFAAVGGALLFRKVWKFSEESITAFGKQEEAEKRLADQMKIVGDYTEEAYQSHLKFASAQQQVTKYGDEETLMMMANLKTYGMSNETLQKATKMTMDLATAKKIDLRTASELVGKAFVGETGTLSRYGIIIDQSVPKTEKFIEVQRVMQKMFGGAAQAEVEQYIGWVAQLTNAWGDLKEKIGSAYIPALKSLAVNLKPIVERAGEWIELNKELLQQKVSERVNLLAQSLGLVVRGLNYMRGSFHAIQADLAMLKLKDLQKDYEYLAEKAEKVGDKHGYASEQFLKLKKRLDEIDKSFKETEKDYKKHAEAAELAAKFNEELRKGLEEIEQGLTGVREESEDTTQGLNKGLTPALGDVADKTKKDVIPSFEKFIEKMEEGREKIKRLKEAADYYWPLHAYPNN